MGGEEEKFIAIGNRGGMTTSGYEERRTFLQRKEKDIREGKSYFIKY